MGLLDIDFGFGSWNENAAIAKKKPVLPVQEFGVPSALSGGIGTAWNALSTTGKVIVGAGVGAGAYATYDWLFGGTKKEAVIAGAGGNDNSNRPSTTISNVYSPVITNTKTITNNVNNQYDYSDNRIWVNGNNNQIETKKAMSASASAAVTPNVNVTPKWEITPSSDSSGGGGGAGGDASAGMDWATIAAIAGVALVAYGYTSRKGSK